MFKHQVEFYNIGDISNYHTGEVLQMENQIWELGHMRIGYCFAKFSSGDQFEYVLIRLYAYDNGPFQKPTLKDLFRSMLREESEDFDGEIFKGQVFTVTATGESMDLCEWVAEQG